LQKQGLACPMTQYQESIYENSPCPRVSTDDQNADRLERDVGDLSGQKNPSRGCHSLTQIDSPVSLLCCQGNGIGGSDRG
jgi:hypothetical protein